MATIKKIVQQDPLGLNRFALTESAYDLITSLIGIYSRLFEREREKSKPEISNLQYWHKRALELNAMYYNEDWADLQLVQNLIEQLSIEYRIASQHEETIFNSEEHDTHPKSETLHSSRRQKSANL